MTKEKLEKEAEEWVNKNKPVQDDWEDSDIIQAIIDTSEPREKRIAELEKENAELKEKLGDVQMQKAGEKSDLVWKLKTANEQKAEQLTEAKGIINNCVHELQIILLHKIRNEERIASILDKTEQFLKEVSE
jgi:ribosomal protein L29